MEDLFQILFFAALILFGLLGNARKKKKGRQVQQRPRVRQPPVERPEPPRGATRAQSSDTAPPARQRSIAQELFELLQERVEVEPAPPPPPAPAPVTEPVIFEDEAQSLETLEPAGGKSHERFHDLYLAEKEKIEPYRLKVPERRGEETAMRRREETAIPYEDVEQRKARLELSRHRLQQAFIMKEILSPPKGMQ